ncbi:tyrosine-type recombinase/integrase [Mesorhizobium dulcispinae]|uniref:tyrosine-type recombinase/integrase n=1 Tax=Mesorhizobium dulcispinae TaxID=3072316 RepID=UPI002A24F1B6|nr:tyrosine-type recombinase/integrase [Mesorhizobium sp. VK23D]MDX8517952.1 tyrosine-type recombinase/integrase [Mesorhizobium sp. VK23D]
MATISITADTVSAVMKAATPNKTKFYFDDDLAGFGFYRTTKGTGTWFAEFRPVAGGSKRRLKLGRVGTLKANEAREAARKAIANAALGKDLAKSRSDERASGTVKELVEAYIAGKAMKESSRAFYRTTLKTQIEPHLGSTKAVAVLRVDVQRAHDKMSKKAKYSANRAMALLSAAFVWGSKRGYVPEGMNPASAIERNREEARERYLTADEMARLGDALREAETSGIPHKASKSKHAPKEKNRTVYGPHVTGAIRLLMLTGCRLREILHVRWDEYDEKRGLLLLPDSKTGKKTVVLSAAAQAEIDSLPRVGVYVIAGQSAATEDEKPRADLKKPWAAIAGRAGIGDVHIHDLRHTFASVGAGDGMSLLTIGKLLGHADTATTQRYAHVDVNPTRAAANAIAGQIAAAIGGR